MQYLKWQNYRTIVRVVSAILLAGLSPVDLHMQSASAQMSAYSLWSSTNQPTIPADPDTEPVELGLKFRSDVPGEINAIRFYRHVAIDSGYVVHLWDEEGNLLGTGVGIEGQQPTPGWQEIQLYPPVSIEAEKTYIASYYASKAQYPVDEDYFTHTGFYRCPLKALQNGGVYTYSTGGGFPTQTYRGSNYWIDVVFKPTTTLSCPTHKSHPKT